MTIEEHKRFGEEHLWYELYMFYKTANHILNGYSVNQEFIKNTIIESSVIHSRVLLEFFFFAPKRSEDAHVKNYILSNFDWDKFILGINDTKELIRLTNRVNWEVAHLSYNRLTISETEKEWRDDLDILGRKFIFPALSQFAEVIDKEKIGPRMNQLLENIR